MFVGGVTTDVEKEQTKGRGAWNGHWIFGRADVISVTEPLQEGTPWSGKRRYAGSSGMERKAAACRYM